MRTHIARYRGALAESIKPWGIPLPPPKTSKTLCGKRVSKARINNTAATCEQCWRELEERGA